MLFSIKNNSMHALAAAIVLASLSLALKHVLGIEWDLYLGEATVGQFLLCLGLVFAADLAIGSMLVVLFHAAFVRLWMEMAGYFSPQRVDTVLAGGVLAAGEEMLFRGVVLQYMIQTPGWDLYYSVAISAALFAAFHILRSRRLALFSLWAFWEGVALGAVYIYSGSLIVTMAVHAIHDIAGFALFSLQRRRGFLLLRKHPGF